MRMVIREREDGTIGFKFPFDYRIVARVKREFYGRGFDRRKKEWWVTKDCAHDLVSFARSLASEGWQVSGIEVAQRLAHKGDALAKNSKPRNRSELHEEVARAGAGLGRSSLKPFPHQAAGYSWLTFAEDGLLCDDMGLGKTKQIIDAFGMAMRENVARRVVIVAPATVKRNWQKEIELNDPGSPRIFLVNGAKSKREKIERAALSAGSCWVIFNYEQTWRSENFAELCVGAAIACDEAHKLANSKTKQTKACAAAFKESVRLVLATGTPVINAATDMFNLVNMVAPGLLGNTEWSFKDRFAIMQSNGFANVVVGWKHEEVIAQRCARVSIRRLKGEVLGLPPKMPPVARECLMTPQQEDAYVSLVETLRADIAGASLREFENAEEFQAMELRATEGQTKVRAAVAMMVKLQQVLDGFIFDTGGNAVFFDNGGSKFLELDEVVDEIVRASGRKLVIWSRFVPPIKYALNRYAEFNPVSIHGGVNHSTRYKNVEAFQNGDARIFIGQIHTAGVGLTLHAAQDQVFISRWWSPAVNTQAEDRLHRIGQTGTVSITNMVAQATDAMIRRGIKSTIDEVVSKTLERKINLADKITGDARGLTVAKLFESAGVTG